MVSRRRLLAAGACAALATRSGQQDAEGKTPRSAVPRKPDRAPPCFGPVTSNQCDVIRRTTADKCTCEAASDADRGECCCDTQDEAAYSCMNVAGLVNNSGCNRVCCESAHNFPCGGGCCQSSMQRAFNISHDGTVPSRGCCGDPSWSQADQLAWRCCLWGDGIDCLTNATCCLRCPEKWRRTGRYPNHFYCVEGKWDPTDTCQASCTGWLSSTSTSSTSTTTSTSTTARTAPPPWYMSLIIPGSLVAGGATVVTGLVFKVWPWYRQRRRRMEEMEGQRRQSMERTLQETPGTGLFALGLWTQTYGGLRDSGVRLPDLSCTELDVEDMNKVWYRLGFTAIPYQESHREKIEFYLEYVSIMISLGQELVPAYIGGHAYQVDNHLFLPGKEASDVSPDEDVFLTKLVEDWRQTPPGREGGSTILLLLDCCRTQVGSQLESYRQRVQKELGVRAQGSGRNKVIIFWACESGQAANEDPIRGKSYFTLAWITTVQKVGKEGGLSEDVTLLEFLLHVKTLTEELSTAECDKPQVPTIDGLDCDLDSVLYSRPFSRNSRRARPLVAETRGPASSSSTGNPCLLTTPCQAVPAQETACAPPEEPAAPLLP